MDEAEFWIKLEYRICRELDKMPEARVRSQWCDGFSSFEYRLDGSGPRIMGRTWIGEGGLYQDVWEYTLLLPQGVNSREEIDWPSLFPPEDVSGWLVLEEDGQRRHLTLDPSAAVPDPAVRAGAPGAGEWLRKVIRKGYHRDVIGEPAGETYRTLLCAAACDCATFSLVWREGASFSLEAEAITAALEPDLDREERVQISSGTASSGGKAAIIRYHRLKERTLEVLLAAPGLYSWCAPDRPEDLALYVRGGGLWLGSVTSERDAFLGAGASRSWWSGRLADISGLQLRERERRR